MAGKKKKDKIDDALMKVALGCRVEEVTEEYAEVDGKMKLTKRKEIKKDIPPDLKAVQMLLAENGEGAADVSMMSDEELKTERERLVQALLKECKAGAQGGGRDAITGEKGKNTQNKTGRIKK
jgi:hypothetical protein